jgi:perosamine synthetase
MNDRAAAASRTTDDALARVVETVDRVLRRAPRPVALHEPRFTARERELVVDCIDTNWVSSGGKYVEQFERVVAQAMGVRHAIAIVNGTVALHAALLLEGIAANDEVIVPAATFVATANAVSHAGAIPHFVDADWRTLGLDPAALDAHLAAIAAREGDDLINRQTGRRIRAVVPVHVFGHPVDMDPLVAVAAKYGLTLIEDATEALGSSYRGRSCGAFGHCAVLSFNGNKIVTTGGGGMILTADDAFAERARHITTTAKRRHAWAFDHDAVGYNFRLPNINAALGCAQMERLPALVAAKRRLADHYRAAFRGLPGVSLYAEPAACRSNYWLNALVLDHDLAAQRDELLSRLHARGSRVPLVGGRDRPFPAADIQRPATARRTALR